MAKFSRTTISEITKVAREHGIEPAALLAICEVESAGRAFSTVNSRREPVIRFEGHYFDRLLGGVARQKARAAGLANPKFGGVKNPRSQAGRWDMLARARAIDDGAALQSCSWGIGQVMGSHWKALGYSSPQALVREARSSVAGQVRLMIRFVESNGLLPLLMRRDWAGFARRYNGPAYRKNRYDEKMAAAYARHSRGSCYASSTVRKTTENWLRKGSRGVAVEEMQRMLVAAGYPVQVDGVFGAKTEAALRRCQTKLRIISDGIFGRKSKAALNDMLQARGAKTQFLATWFVRAHKWMPVLRLLSRLRGWTR
ncbi:MAG: N-acetylmuramidase domain-containing protein [Pseudomonadota bacterium]